MPELVKGKRKFSNPLARYYIEPFGEWIAERLKNSWITPNMVSAANVAVGLLMGLLILEGSWLSLIIFGLWVRMFHVFDVTDGHLARIRGERSKYGAYIDGISDRLVMIVWSALILYALFARSPGMWWMFWGIAFMVGAYLYFVTQERAFQNFGGQRKTEQLQDPLKGNLLSQAFLFWIDGDIQFHLLSLGAFLNRPEWFIYFYAIYFNLMWIAIIGYYSLQNLRKLV